MSFEIDRNQFSEECASAPLLNSSDLLCSLAESLSPIEKPLERQSYLNKFSSGVISCFPVGNRSQDAASKVCVEFIKTASLFTGGRLGLALTAASHGLERASPEDKASKQLADLFLGSASGAATRSMFSFGLKGPITPLKAAVIGSGAAISQEILATETFVSPETLNERLRKSVLNPESILMSSLLIGGGQLAYAGLSKSAFSEALKSREFSSMLMAGSFGFLTGTASEAAEQLKDGSSIDFVRLFAAGVKDGALQAAAAGTAAGLSNSGLQARLGTTLRNLRESGYPLARQTDLKTLRLAEPELTSISARVKESLNPFGQLMEKYLPVSKSMKAQGLKDAPSAAELAALEVYSDGDYARINKVLRGAKLSLLDRILYPFNYGPGVSMEGVTLLASSALNKLPSYQGRVYREVFFSKDQIGALQAGSLFKEAAFASTSSQLQGAAKRMGNTLFVIDSRTGVSIERFSRHPFDKEILFAPGAEFEILSKKETRKRGQPLTVIKMQEKQENKKIRLN